MSDDYSPLGLRAWTLTRMLLQQTKLVRRYTRVVLAEELEQRRQRSLGYEFAPERIARM